MSEKINAPRGTKDVLPSESYKWQYVEQILRETAAQYSHTEIRFPTFEHTELFLRGVGDTTDVVSKEMYTFEDKGGRSITLRPEGTASVVRSFIENSLYAGPLPVKCYYIAPNFRYEKPQAGRLREHHQFGAEVFGSYDPLADAELLSLASTFIKRLGITNVPLYINSIGCAKCRPDYHKALKEYFADKTENLCHNCVQRLEKNPLRVLDCKSPVCSEIGADAPSIIDYICSECDDHFTKLQSYLGQMDIEFTINPRIVRGLDYYTNTVFEFVADCIGSQAAICAGGRYNGLVGQLGGADMAGLGFGSGIERLLMVMEAQGVEIPVPQGIDIFIAALGDSAVSATTGLVHKLRQASIRAERDLLGRSLKAQMKYADKTGVVYTTVLGDDEVQTGEIKVKNMATGETQTIELSPDALINFIKK